MKTHIYSLRDVKAGYYMNMVLLRNDVDAERFFLAILEDQRSPIAKFPKDYAIFWIGTFDNESGEVIPLGIPKDVTPHSAVDNFINQPKIQLKA